MPVTELLVEGALDSILLTAVLGGRPVVKEGGSKNALKPRAADERSRRKVAVAYIRDRDFDFEPPPDRSRPAVHEEFRLPDDLSAAAVSAWARGQAERFRDRIYPKLAPGAVQEAIDQRRALLSDDLLKAPDEILVWLSGKDLMAALAPWLSERGFANPGAFRARLRDWVRDHPEDAVSLLPEWGNFIALLRA